jgi:hypothetical protein
MSNYEKAFDLIGISRSGGGFWLSGGATGEAPYDPYRMWVDKGNIHENSSIGVSQQLKKQGQIEAKAREEYEREQRKQWDEAHKNEKSGSFSDAEKQQRDADIKQKMKEYDSDLTLQKKTIKRIRPDLSSAEAANERRAAERKGESKQQREDAALAAAHSYLEGIDDGHGEPDLSSGGTPPPKKKQSVSGDTNKVAQEALGKTAFQKETSAAEIKRPVIVEPDNLEMKDDATLLTYETEGVYYALYAYNEDEFGQVVIPTDITDLIGYGYYGDYLLNIGEGGAITLAEHTEVDEVPPATMPWSMLFGEYIDGVGYRWDEKRSGAPFGAWCIGYGGNEYHPFTAFGSAGQVLTAQGEDAPPFFSHLDITDLAADGFNGEYVVNVVGGKVGLSSLPPDDVGLKVVTPEDLVMYKDADVLYGIGYAFYAYDGENFGQTTIPPPSGSQYQMLFGADQSTSPGRWVTETPTPGSLMFINYDYAAPDWIPTPLAAGAVLKTIGGTDNPVFESMYIQELISTGGPGTFVLGVDVDGAVSLSTHTEVNEVPPSARKWDMLFGANQSTNPGEWAAWYAETYGLMWFNYDATSESYNPALIGQSDSGKVLVSTGFNTAPAFRYLYGGDIYDISSYTGDSLPGGIQGDILYNTGSDWKAVSPRLNSVFCFEKNTSKPEPIFLYNDYASSYNIHKYLHFSGYDATPSVDQIEIEHTITTNGDNYSATCLISVNEYGEVTLTPYAYSGMLISNLMDPYLSSCEILLQLNGDGDAAAKEIVDPAGTMSGDYVMVMNVTAGVRTFNWVTYGA